MRDSVRAFLLVVNIVSFIFVCLFGLVGVVVDIIGPGEFDRLLARFNIAWSFDQGTIAGYICLAVLIITYFSRKKLFKV